MAVNGEDSEAITTDVYNISKMRWTDTFYSVLCARYCAKHSWHLRNTGSRGTNLPHGGKSILTYSQPSVSAGVPPYSRFHICGFNQLWIVAV